MYSQDEKQLQKRQASRWNAATTKTPHKPSRGSTKLNDPDIKTCTRASRSRFSSPRIPINIPKCKKSRKTKTASEGLCINQNHLCATHAERSLLVSSSSSRVLTPDQFPTTGLGNSWEHILTFQTLFDALFQTFSIQDYLSLRSSLRSHVEVPRVPRWVNTFHTRSTLLPFYSSLVGWLQYTFSRVDGWMVAQGMKCSLLSFLGWEIFCTWRSSNTVLSYSFPSFRRVVTCIL